ncbi:MAG: trigger factor [Bacillota bacterium]
MKATAEKVAKNTVLLEIEVEPEKLAQAIDKTYRELVKKVNIPGFRRGKAPRIIFERYYGRETLVNEAVESLVPEAYLDAVKQTGIEPIANPDVEIAQAEEGKPVIFKARVEVKPEVTLGPYKGLEVEKPPVEVTEADVDREIERLRERYARLVTLEEGVVQKGDIVTIDYEGTVDGKPFKGSRATDRTVEVGLGFLVDEFDTQLLGMAVNETKEITVKLPENYHDEGVAGKEAVFQVTVKGIRRKELAAIDDEFAKDVSEFDTLEELKADLRHKLEVAAEKRAEAAVREALVDKATAAAEVEVPERMVEARVESMTRELLRPALQQGLTPENYFELTNTNPEELREKLRPEAERALKRELVLDAIARTEGLGVSEEELDRELKRIAEFYRQDADRVKEALTGTGELAAIEKRLLRGKAIDFLVAHAQVK